MRRFGPASPPSRATRLLTTLLAVGGVCAVELPAANAAGSAVSVCLVTRGTKFVSAEHGNVHLRADRTRCGAWETFTLEPTSGGLVHGATITIRTSRDTYLTAAADGTLRDDGANNANARFTIRRVDGKRDPIGPGTAITLWSPISKKYVYDGGGGVPNAKSGSVGAGERFRIAGGGGTARMACLSTRHGKFVSAEHDHRRLKSNRAACGPWETFSIAPFGGALESGATVFLETDRGTFLSARPDGDLLDDQPAALEYEAFRIAHADGRTGPIQWGKEITLQSVKTGKYIYDGNGHTLKAGSKAAGAGERFRLAEGFGDRKEGCLLTAGKKYVSAEHDNPRLVANRSACGPWEKLTFIAISGALKNGAVVYVRTDRGTYLSARPDGALLDDQKGAVYDEQFVLETSGRLSNESSIKLRSVATGKYVDDGRGKTLGARTTAPTQHGLDFTFELPTGGFCTSQDRKRLEPLHGCSGDYEQSHSFKDCVKNCRNPTALAPWPVGCCNMLCRLEWNYTCACNQRMTCGVQRAIDDRTVATCVGQRGTAAMGRALVNCDAYCKDAGKGACVSDL